MIFERDVLPMVATYCPVCRQGPKIDCCDMKRCPLAIAKFTGEMISLDVFAGRQVTFHEVAPQPPQQPPPVNQVGQFLLF